MLTCSAWGCFAFIATDEAVVPDLARCGVRNSEETSFNALARCAHTPKKTPTRAEYEGVPAAQLIATPRVPCTEQQAQPRPQLFSQQQRTPSPLLCTLPPLPCSIAPPRARTLQPSLLPELVGILHGRHLRRPPPRSFSPRRARPHPPCPSRRRGHAPWNQSKSNATVGWPASSKSLSEQGLQRRRARHVRGLLLL